MLRILVPLATVLGALAVAEIALQLAGYPPCRPTFWAVEGEDGPLVKDWHELFLRRSDDPLLDYEFVPNKTSYLCYSRPWRDYFDAKGRVANTINSLGLRDAELTPRPAPGTHRILCLGDSFTLGFGVPLEDSFPKQLERMLRARFAGRALEVVNAGYAGGLELKGYVAYLLARGLALEPRTVLLTICLNDVARVPMAIQHFTDTEIPGRSWCRLAKLLSSAITELRARWLAADPGKCDALCPPRDAEVRWRESLEIGRDACAARGLRFLVFIYPMMVGLDAHYPWIRIHERILAFCREKGIAAEDLLPAFRGRDARSLWVHPSDQHPNPTGHAIAARAILAALERRRWVP